MRSFPSDMHIAFADAMRRVQGHAQGEAQIMALENYRQSEKAIIAQNHANYRERRIQKEAIEIMSEQQYRLEGKFLDDNSPLPDTWQQCRNLAASKVDAAFQTQQQTIDQKCYDHLQAIIGEVAVQRAALKQEVKAISSTYWRKQIDYARDFEANKSHYVAAARKAGSKTPERDVYQNFRVGQLALETERVMKVTQYHKQHGFSYQPEQTMSLRMEYGM